MAGYQGFGENTAFQQDYMLEAILEAMHHLKKLALNNNLVVENLI